MKKKIYFLAIVLLGGITVPVQAQFLNRLSKQVGEKIDKSTDKDGTASTNATSESSGKTYYVSPNGSVRSDGLSKEKPLKSLQKAIDLAEDGSTILVAEGNYLGNMDCGYIECGRFGNGADNGKFLKFYGGYSLDFSERNPTK